MDTFLIVPEHLKSIRNFSLADSIDQIKETAVGKLGDRFDEAGIVRNKVSLDHLFRLALEDLIKELLIRMMLGLAHFL